MGKFVISKRFNGEYQFNLKASNGQTILASEGYVAKSSCEQGIQAVKQSVAIEARFERKTSSNGKYYFSIKAGNGQIIGSSEMYETSSARDNGIESVKKNAPGAEIEDATL